MNILEKRSFLSYHHNLPVYLMSGYLFLRQNSLEEFEKQYLTNLSHANKELSMMFKLLPIIFMTFHIVQSMMNGLYADLGDFPFVVAIHNFNLYRCSGILINEFNVLTVGHTVDVTSNHLKLSVVVGKTMISNILDGSGDTYAVETVYAHPQFVQYIPEEGNEDSFLHDIAVLKLYHQVHVTASIGWASLMNAEAPRDPNADCSIISWTRTSPKYMKLMWDKVKYLSDEVSHPLGTYMLPNQKGFNDLLEHDSISSDDIGSPIVCNNQVIGLVVKGERHDQPERFSTLLLIYNYLEFIWEIMAEGLFDIHPWKFPYVATIWALRVPLCGGFIVDETHIGTTGSCTRKINLINGSVTVGYTTVVIYDPNINWLSIKNIVKHPNYNVPSHYWPMRKSPNDIAVITLTESLVWSPTILPLMMGNSENFAGGQICQVLRWVRTPKDSQGIMGQLALKRSLVIIWTEAQLKCFQAIQEDTSFWGRTPYVMPVAELIDGGNPIICGDYPIGMVLQDSKPMKWDGPKSARFLKIRPYIQFINSVTSRT